MNTFLNPEKNPLSETGLNGFSLSSPAIVGDDLFGLSVVWSDLNTVGTVNYSSNAKLGIWSDPVPLTDHETDFSPAIAIAYNRFAVAIVWVDSDGAVMLTLSPGTTPTIIPITDSKSAVGSPAIVYGNGILYIGWQDPDNYLWIATYDEEDKLTTWNTQTTITSAPSLTWYETTLYACAGGHIQRSANMSFFASYDGGNSFTLLNAPGYPTLGPPSMIIQDGVYFIVYADENYYLNVIITTDLTSATNQKYSQTCLGGAPSLTVTMGNINVAWTYGLPPSDPRNREVFVGTINIQPFQNILTIPNGKA